MESEKRARHPPKGANKWRDNPAGDQIPLFGLTYERVGMVFFPPWEKYETLFRLMSKVSISLIPLGVRA